MIEKGKKMFLCLCINVIISANNHNMKVSLPSVAYFQYSLLGALHRCLQNLASVIFKKQKAFKKRKTLAL